MPFRHVRYNTFIQGRFSGYWRGYPCIFYGDYYSISEGDIPPMRDTLLPLMQARRQYAYGKQNDYFDHENTIGWTREGDAAQPGSGLAVLLTNASDGEKQMYVGERFAGTTFRDLTGNRKERITIEKDGNAGPIRIIA